MTTPDPADLLLIGVIVAPFGVRGQVKLKSLTDRPEHLIRRVRTLYVGAAHMPYTLSKAFEHKPGLLILTLQGVGSRDAAEELRSAEVFIPQSAAAPLDPDEYFLHDLVGLQVFTAAGDAIGSVREVLTTGANDVIVVRRTGMPDALIPMVRDIVSELDIPAGRIVITPIEGLL